MKKIAFGLPLLPFILMEACRPIPETVPLPTKICVKTTHHNFPIPNATIYVKFNADSFPGYEQPPSYYDDIFQTEQNAHGCLESVPEGRHWLVAFGYDSLHYPHDVFGSLPVVISLTYKPVIDTMLYVSEKH